MSAPLPRPAPDPPFREEVDWHDGCIHAHGAWTPQAADLVAATVALLHRAGHAHVTLELSEVAGREQPPAAED